MICRLTEKRSAKAAALTGPTASSSAWATACRLACAADIDM